MQSNKDRQKRYRERKKAELERLKQELAKLKDVADASWRPGGGSVKWGGDATGS